ncbi:type II secretion system protein [Microvirga sp. 2TAF3]|uniref:type II secretion system protein n=1 Tax=Microvirga sp. 2TAF3 TaxID=3233014 RepID=UPI003F9D89CF
MTVRQHTADKAGFALVELLVAIAVAGLAGSILVGLLAFLERNSAETERRIREHESVLAVERILRILVAGAPAFVPGAPIRSGGFGNEREFTVLSVGPPILGLPRSAVFTLRREGQSAVSDIVLTWTDEGGEGRQEIVAQNISDSTFAYLPLQTNSPDATWRSRWRAEDGPLRALRLSLRFAPASIARVIVIPMQADFPATCLRNPRQIGCTLEHAWNERRPVVRSGHMLSRNLRLSG